MKRQEGHMAVVWPVSDRATDLPAGGQVPPTRLPPHPLHPCSFPGLRVVGEGFQGAAGASGAGLAEVFACLDQLGVIVVV